LNSFSIPILLWQNTIRHLPATVYYTLVLVCDGSTGVPAPAASLSGSGQLPR
jgi:hypothetical protein